MMQKSGLKKILETDENGKPILHLIPMKKTAVNTKTQEEYWDLMRIYECGGWKWGSGCLPTLPKERNRWEICTEEFCAEAGFDYFNDDLEKFRYASKKFYKEMGYNIISPQEFYDKQESKITPEMIKEINDFFDGK